MDASRLPDHEPRRGAHPLNDLQLWVDSTPRPGPESMAVDEWLLGWAAAAGVTVLRVYRWAGASASFGYAHTVDGARRILAAPEVSWVRRWTGGGVVDHRFDWPFTLAIPAVEPLAAQPAPERFRQIHLAVAAALAAEGIATGLSSGPPDGAAPGPDCFASPARHDLLDANGRKIAGAGQRRTRAGVLHQGSVAGCPGSPPDPQRAHRLARSLGRHVAGAALDPPPDILAAILEARYLNPTWRRPASRSGSACG